MITAYLLSDEVVEDTLLKSVHSKDAVTPAAAAAAATDTQQLPTLTTHDAVEPSVYTTLHVVVFDRKCLILIMAFDVNDVLRSEVRWTEDYDV